MYMCKLHSCIFQFHLEFIALRIRRQRRKKTTTRKVLEEGRIHRFPQKAHAYKRTSRVPGIPLQLMTRLLIIGDVFEGLVDHRRAPSRRLPLQSMMRREIPTLTPSSSNELVSTYYTFLIIHNSPSQRSTWKISKSRNVPW